MRKTLSAGLVLAGLATILATTGWAAPYGDYCTRVANSGLSLFDSQRALLSDGAAGLDTSRRTPGWILACIEAGKNVQEADRAAAALTGAMCTEGAEAGRLPWSAGGIPWLAADEVAMPPLCAALVFHPTELSSEAKTALATSMRDAAAAFKKGKPRGLDTQRLTYAAACFALGRALDDSGLTQIGAKNLQEWLALAQDSGLRDGHGPTTEAYRLAALAWIHRFAKGPASPDWTTAWQFLWADLLQRLPGPAGPLAGPMLFNVSPDSLDGMGPLRWMMPLAFAQGGGKLPAEPGKGGVGMSSLDAAYFCLPFSSPLAGPYPAPPKTPTMLTYTWSLSPLHQENVYLSQDFSLGTMSGEIGNTTVPLVVTWPGLGQRPTSYVYTSASGNVAALQDQGTAALNFDFDDVGSRQRRQVWTDFVIGRRADIKSVTVFGQSWNGKAMAVDELTPVVAQIGNCYLGVVIGWCGPAKASELTERVSPGVLSWSKPGPDGELVLRMYARHANYVLPKPENNYVVGLLTAVRPVGAGGIQDFITSLRHVRYKKGLQSRTWQIPSKNKDTSPLDTHKPKPKQDYGVGHATDYTLTWMVGGVPWVLGADLTSGSVTTRSIGGQALPAPTLQFNTPFVKHAPETRAYNVLAAVQAAVAEH